VVRAVLFDVDGVLVHPWRFRATLARDHGITPEMTAAFFKGPFIRCAQGQADVLEVLPAFLASWGWPGSAADFVARWLSVENAPDHAVFGVVADIRRSGVPCFVASTQERRRAQYLAVEMRFDQFFDGLFFSCDIGVEKPREDFFNAIAHRLGRPGTELLFIDDVRENVEGARAAGWFAEQFQSAGGLRADVARYTQPALRAG
jgi:putative hydrolase of the HAD superfamily